MKKPLFLMLLGFLPACISLKTYEERMKECREVKAHAEQMEDELSDLRDEKRNIEIEYGRSEKEQQALQKEVTTQSETIRIIRGIYDDLVNELKEEIVQGSVNIVQRGDSLTIGVENKILFGSGETVLRGQGEQVLSRVAKILKEMKKHEIRVEGYTDNIPVSSRLKKKYPTNWELSAARAAVVVRYLMEEGQIDPHILMVAAFGEFRPLADNLTEIGRELNRRVEISVIPKGSDAIWQPH